ncbi:hypothetical protein [Halobacteriovorax sp.]|uniref:hypothetical protein n=1 Tax=Halobacteriovorax sp. TaxID=2020862 RepID=UPI00356AA64D
MKKSISLFIIIFCFSLSSWGIDVKIPESECSDVDVRENMNPEMKEHFSTPRNQDGIGWCYAFSAADLLTAEMKEPVSASHVSAIFNKNIDNSTFMKLGYNIGRLFNEGTFGDSYEGGWVDRALENAVDEKRVCSEEALPFDRNYRGETAGIILRLEEIKAGMKDESTAKIVSCNEIDSLISFRELNGLSASELYSILEQNNMNTALSIILKKRCSENLIKLKDFEIDSLSKPRPRVGKQGRKMSDRIRVKKGIKRYFGKIGDILSSGKPMGISYNVDNIMDSSGGHASVLTGRRWKDGKCQFKIRNSWGRGCRSYDMDKIEECNYEEGSFWVDDKRFYDMVTDLDYISN